MEAAQPTSGSAAATDPLRHAASRRVTSKRFLIGVARKSDGHGLWLPYADTASGRRCSLPRRVSHPQGATLDGLSASAKWRLERRTWVNARARDRRVAPFDAAFHPSWAPDGRRLLCYRPNALFVTAADGSPPRPLLGNPEIPGVGTRRPSRRVRDTAGTPTIWTARTDGSGARPGFSPDPRAIASALRDRVWIMPAAGGRARPVSAAALGEVVHGLDFLPDGRFVVIARQRQTDAVGPSRLFVVRRRDGHERMLHVGALASSPDWQPLPRQ